MMEDDEEPIIDNGYCNLRFSLLENIPLRVLDLGGKLIRLNLSNNRIKEINGGISSLVLLQDLNLSNNKLEHVDDGIAECVRLRKVNFSGNKLNTIPNSLFIKCTMLEELCLGRNTIQYVPPSICKLPVLAKLEIQDNNFRSIPVELSTIPTLKEINCLNNNHELNTLLPDEIKVLGNNIILWSLRLRYNHKKSKHARIKSCRLLEHNLERLHQQRSRLVEEISNIEESTEFYTD